MTKSTLTLTQSGLLALLLEHQRRKAIELARRRAQREHLRAALGRTFTPPFRALTAQTLVDDSARRLVRTVPRRFESIAMSPQVHTYTELRQENRQDQSFWTRNVISQRPRALVTRIQQLVALATLGVLLWLWFGGSRYQSPQPSYPYYDTQKPVPPWSEPALLEGNYSRQGD